MKIHSEEGLQLLWMLRRAPEFTFREHSAIANKVTWGLSDGFAAISDSKLDCGWKCIFENTYFYDLRRNFYVLCFFSLLSSAHQGALLCCTGGRTVAQAAQRLWSPSEDAGALCSRRPCLVWGWARWTLRSLPPPALMEFCDSFQFSE